MPDSQLTKKLGIKAGYALLLLNAPDTYQERVGEAATEANGAFDVVQAFVASKADVDRYAQTAIGSVKPGGLLWLTYPKKSGAIKPDITRDQGWESVYRAGWRPVAQVAIDDDWSALRWRPNEDVKATSDRFDPSKRG